MSASAITFKNWTVTFHVDEDPEENRLNELLFDWIMMEDENEKPDCFLARRRFRQRRWALARRRANITPAPASK